MSLLAFSYSSIQTHGGQANVNFKRKLMCFTQGRPSALRLCCQTWWMYQAAVVGLWGNAYARDYQNMQMWWFPSIKVPLGSSGWIRNFSVTCEVLAKLLLQFHGTVVRLFGLFLRQPLIHLPETHGFQKSVPDFEFIIYRIYASSEMCGKLTLRTRWI